MTVFATNKKANYDYEILDKYEAGIVLFGHEVKSVKAGHINLSGSFISITRGGEAILMKASIPKYAKATLHYQYEPERPRKLLLHKNELERLLGSLTQKALTVVPLNVYSKNNRIKLEFALVKNKKAHDKRATIKDRDQKREISRMMKYD